MIENKTLELAKKLISRSSITPDDSGCLDLISQILNQLNFNYERLDVGFNKEKVSNLWAIKKSQKLNAKTLVFAGHIDVVPPGNLEKWQFPPFEPTVFEGKLFGRGASDMKSSIASFVIACEEFLKNESLNFNLAFLLTSDEEGPSINGTNYVIKELIKREEKIDWCIVGEPTAVKTTGDTIKNGRRGTLGGKLTVFGIQGHIAYPHLAKNPILEVLEALNELKNETWDNGNEFFPPTSWQISNISAGTGATNVIPGELNLDFNFRYSTENTDKQLKGKIHKILDKNNLNYKIDWQEAGQPFLTPKGELLKIIEKSILEETNLKTEISTTGGTSDGRFIAKICSQVVELGPPNDSIHKVNEYIFLSELECLKNLYKKILRHLNKL